MKDKLLEIARSSHVVDAAALTEFLERHSDEQRLDQALLKSGLFAENAVLQLFGRLLDIPYLEQVRSGDVPMEFVSKIPASYAQQHGLVAVSEMNSIMTVAISEPLNLYPLDNVGKMLNCPVQPVLATRAAITAAINAAYEQRVTVLAEVAGEVDSQNIEGLIGEMATSEDLLDVVKRAYPPL